LPDTATGGCPSDPVPVFRLWNHRADSNHRYVTDPVVRAQMIARGYVPEGYGPLGTAMCSPGAVLSDARVRVSTATPYTGNCDGVVPPPGGTFLYVNGEVEPMLAVDPTNASHLVGVWQQDRWFNGGARGLRTGVSFDGGRSWSLSQAAFSRCSGGTPANGGDFARASDPWVTMAADGTAYQIAISFNGGTLLPGGNNAVLVSRSSDGGLTWGNPITLKADAGTFFNDKESITADRGDANFVYATWDRIATNNNGPTWFSRTVNGGASWEAARVIYDPGLGNQTINNQVVSLPSGTQVLFFSEFAGARISARVLRSLDKGATWSAPIEIAQTFSVGAHNPATGTSIRDGGNLGSIAAGSNGQLAAVWQDSRFSAGARDGVAFSRSLDGGLTWSTPVRVNAVASAQGFLPAVTIRDDGKFGVLYYDDRNNVPGSTFAVDIWLAESSDGVTWTERHVSGSFDLARAPIATDAEGAGYFVGDYQALQSAGTAFLPFYVQTNIQNDPNNVTDVFASILTAAGPASALAKRATATPYQAASAPEPSLTPELVQRLERNAERTLARRKVGVAR
jgi:BNR repeat protein